MALPGWSGPRGVLSALSVVAAVILWLAFAGSLGFLATTALVVPALALGAGVAGTLHLIFSVALRVPLPRGPVEALLP